MLLQDLVEQTRGEDDALLVREDDVVQAWAVLGTENLDIECSDLDTSHALVPSSSSPFRTTSHLP
jgi:hypothetical protein